MSMVLVTTGCCILMTQVPFWWDFEMLIRLEVLMIGRVPLEDVSLWENFDFLVQ